MRNFNTYRPQSIVESESEVDRKGTACREDKKK
jgi:hypothetical protein